MGRKWYLATRTSHTDDELYIISETARSDLTIHKTDSKTMRAQEC